jgi:hypothetical protein
MAILVEFERVKLRKYRPSRGVSDRKSPIVIDGTREKLRRLRVQLAACMDNSATNIAGDFFQR